MEKTSGKKLYVICNSHLDPVWIWRRRSGRTAWTNTMHSVVRMMKTHPQLKFTCSAAALYRWIEDTEPALFRQIAELVEAGRWEIVGGWEVQADAIISGTEALIRQAVSAKEYFQRKFGIDVRTAYSVDSFGHSAGLPKILKATGFDNYVFLRPMSHQMDLPLLFNWQADDGSSVRALRIFDTYDLENVDRQFYMDRIDEHIRKGLPHQTLFFGVGDHGGGLYEKHLQWLDEASEKYEIVFSTLAEYFAELPQQELPAYKGEMSNVFRGCYSACHEVKRQIALAMDRLESAEKLGIPARELDYAWKEILFNHFH
ncbi:MAG: alpha-mannosidase, partial [Victivallales bacterium]|nr:alpha-mannosidase [Victivallales bacterium]